MPRRAPSIRISVSSTLNERPPTGPSPLARLTVEFAVGDLVDEEADVLIAPALDAAGPSSRVQLALRRSAGDALGAAYDLALTRLPGRHVPENGNVVTQGYGLRCAHVVHCLPSPAPAAGDTSASVDMLQRCVRGAFARCVELGAKTIALPAIGTGAYGYRVSTVAAASMRSVLETRRAPGGPNRVRFVLAGSATLEAFLRAFSDERERERDLATARPA